ncbi:MAG: TrkA C-terminal domain-containing protein [Lautropia sp.]|nr:TrkA C-terminal domain-containing protein [Lautropia sp.]
MSELANFLAAQPMLALFLTITLGHLAGAINVKGFALGSGAVLFVGLVIGAIAPESAMPSIVGSLGLLMYLYGVGLAYGAQFFNGLTSPFGLKANLASVIGVLVTAALTMLIVEFYPGAGFDEMLGVFAGAGTSTPSLQAAMAKTGNTLPATGYSVAYPFGVAIPILIIGLYNAWFKPKFPPQERISLKMYAVRIENAYVVGKTLEQLVDWLPEGVGASTVYRDGVAHSAEVHGVLQLGDVVLITGVDSEKMANAEKMLGVHVGDSFRRSHGELDYLRLFVSNPKLAGMTIREVKQMLKFETAILHVRRVDEDISVTPDSHLEIGDQIGILAHIDHIPDLRRVFGDSVRSGGEISFVAIGLGMSIGLLVGAIPLNIPGVGRLSLGFAGLLLVALYLAKLRKSRRLIWTMPVPANLALRNFGLSVFLAQVGMSSGQTFVDTVSESGFYLLAGIVLVAVLTMVVLTLTVYVFKLPFDQAAGVVSGATGNPAIIAFTSRTLGTDKSDIAYAMIYPSMTILKIIVVHIVGAIGLGS